MREIAEHIGKKEGAVFSLLNRGRHWPINDVPLAEREVGLTSKKCARCKLEKSLSDFAITKMNGAERRWSYCKPCEIARMAERREKGLHLVKTRRHVAKHRERYPEQAEVNRLFSAQIRAGRIVRPDTCKKCGQTPPRNRLGRSNIQGHHDDYSKPFEVRWLCQSCHIRLHKELRDGV